jgi:hypothetical protein
MHKTFAAIFICAAFGLGYQANQLPSWTSISAVYVVGMVISLGIAAILVKS